MCKYLLFDFRFSSLHCSVFLDILFYVFMMTVDTHITLFVHFPVFGCFASKVSHTLVWTGFCLHSTCFKWRGSSCVISDHLIRMIIWFDKDKTNSLLTNHSLAHPLPANDAWGPSRGVCSLSCYPAIHLPITY